MPAILKAAQVRARAVELDLQRASADELHAQMEAVRAEALREGYAAGRAQALAEGVTATDRLATALQVMVSQAERSQVAAIADASQTILTAAVEIAEWLVRTELGDLAHNVVGTLTEITRSLVMTEPCTLFVHFTDVGSVTTWAASHPTWEVTVDPQLAPGEVRVVTRTGTAELIVADALMRAREALGLEHGEGA